MASPEPFHSLADNPRRHFAEFERQVYDTAGSSCTDLFPHGLLSLVVSDTIWAQLPNNTTLVDDVPIVSARNSFPPPIQPADNATTGVWKSFETRRKQFDLYHAAAQLLLQRLKLTLPTADIAILSHPILGLASSTSLEIMNHLRQTYGTFRATDFSQLYLDLDEHMAPTATFADFSSRFKFIFAQFETNGQPISQLQQCTYLTRAIRSHPHLVKAQDFYFQQFPDPSTRTFSALVAHITLHAPNFAVTSADFGYAAPVIATPTDTLQAFLKSQQFSTILASAIASKSSGHQRRRDSTPTHPPSSSDSRKYCFLHGYDWHDSRQCRNMAKDLVTYSEAMRTSRSHTSPPGGSTTKL
jgi:hypothetical protein